MRGLEGLLRRFRAGRPCSVYQLHSLLDQSAVGLQRQQAGSVEVAKGGCLGAQSLSQTWTWVRAGYLFKLGRVEKLC